MKVKKCQGEGCSYEGGMWGTINKLKLCKNCYHKTKAIKQQEGVGTSQIALTATNGEIQSTTTYKYVKVSFTPKVNTSPVKPQTKLEDKSHPELLKLAQICFNRFIRERDSQGGYFTCISSGDRLTISQMQAGHLFPVSTSSMLRFDEDNCHGQSIEQNCFNGSHQINYRKNLIEKIGRFRVERLESLQHVEKKWSKEELLEIINKYKK